ncbi:MAG: cation transporter [Actinomycetota bacterium]|nr:cation transporter [Actinomycetota bacterium]MDQ3707887.1 cation transporter [Actinomycetota bacterium]
MTADTTISVPEIHCGHCKTAIEGALRPLEGVHAATVDVPARTVTVEHDTTVGREEIVQTIEEQGYEVP